MKSIVFKRLYQAHLYGGLFVALHLVVLILTGSVLLFRGELETDRPLLTTQELTPWTGETLDRILTDAITRFPGERPLAIFPDESDNRLIQVRLGKENSKKFRGARKLLYSGKTALPIEAPQNDDGFFGTLLVLHRELFLGTYGKLYVGFVGLILVFVLLSGFFIYGNFMRGKSFGEIRDPRSTRAYSDAHRFIGACAFAWLLLVSMTGVLLSFNGPLLKIYQAGELKSLSQEYANVSTQAALPKLATVVETAQRLKPHDRLTYIAFPDTEFSIPSHFLILMNGTTAFTSKLSELLVVDRETGTEAQARQLPIYLKLALISEPLHFGNYGGMVLKLVWLAFSLLSMALTASGVAAFILKKTRKPADPVHKSTPFTPFQSRAMDRVKRYFPAIVLGLGAIGIVLTLVSDGWIGWIGAATVALPLVFVIGSLRAAIKRRGSS